jgi:hypothetical protein
MKINDPVFWKDKKKRNIVHKKHCADCGKLKSDKGKYCKSCGYKHRKRPTGLTYNIVVDNPTWFHVGAKANSSYRIPVGNIPWQTGTKGKVKPNSGCFTHERVGGSANINWKGGVTSFYFLVRGIPEYKKWRDAIYQRDGYKCLFCGQVGGKLNVDHIEPMSHILRKNNIKTIEDAKKCHELWDETNGRVLCKSCHEGTSTYKGRARNYETK